LAIAGSLEAFEAVTQTERLVYGALDSIEHQTDRAATAVAVVKTAF
jgi:hypothetical protein